MKKIFCITLSLIITLLPVTSAKADVTFGDNNNYQVTENQFYLARKMAVMNFIPELLNQGISEISFENVNSVDQLTEDILDDIDTAWSNPRTEYEQYLWDDIDKLHNYINTKANKITDNLIMNDMLSVMTDTTLLQTVMDNGLFEYKEPVTFSDTVLMGFNALSLLGSDTPTPEPDINYQQYIARINDRATYGQYVGYDFFWKNNWFTNTGNNYGVEMLQDPKSFSYILTQTNTQNISDGINSTARMIISQPVTIYITGEENSWQYNSSAWTNVTNQVTQYKQDHSFKEYYSVSISNYYGGFMDKVYAPNPNGDIPLQSRLSGTGTSLIEIFDKIYWYFRNVNIYVNGVPWAVVNTVQNYNININGMDYYNQNEQPVQYQYPSTVDIDYKKLYDVIYQAIIDAQPVNQTVINEGDVYYDNTTQNYYSPTIYNYYGDDDDDEDDFIKNILDLAIIPKFDSALVEPLSEPVTNGVIVLQTVVQSFPQEIMIILGAGFVLILFVALINRMME